MKMKLKLIFESTAWMKFNMGNVINLESSAFLFADFTTINKGLGSISKKHYKVSTC